MARRNKIISCSYHSEIHERLASGEKIIDVCDWYNSLEDRPYDISYKSFQRYFNQYVHQKDKIKARYNQKKAEREAKKEIDKQVDKQLKVDDDTDAYTERQVDEIEMLDEFISQARKLFNLKNLTDKELGEFIIKWINTKYQIVGSTDDESFDFNLFNFFSDDDGDILDDVRDTDG